MVRNNWKDLEIVRKRTKIYELYIKKNGSPIDISDYIVYFITKKDMKDLDANAVIYKKIGSATGCDDDHADASNGKTLITLSSSNTDITAGTYWYDIVIKDNEDQIIEAYMGRIRVTEPVMKDIN